LKLFRDCFDQRFSNKACVALVCVVLVLQAYINLATNILGFDKPAQINSMEVHVNECVRGL